MQILKVAFNPKNKVNKEVKHRTDIVFNIKHCLDNLLENNYLNQEDYNFMRSCGINSKVLYGPYKVHKNLLNLMD